MLEKNNPKKIVIMRTDRIGEVLLSTIAVDAVRKQYPVSSVTFVTSAYSKPLIEGRDDLDEVITADTKSKKKWIVKAVQLASVLRKRKFDLAIILNPHKMLHLAVFLAGIPCRAGYSRKWGFLLNRKIRDERGEGKKHEVEYTMDLLRSLGIEEMEPVLHLPVEERAEGSITKIFSKKGIDPDKPVIAIHPGSSNPVKIWSSDSYAELVRKVKTELNCNVVILGTADERILSEDIIKKANRGAINLVGDLDLKELAALLARSALFIGNDTGPMHMAAALGVPVIAIFRQEAPGAGPTRWRPWGEGHVVFHESPGEEVAVGKVFEAVKKIMK
jgi:heptosyltransferase-2